MPALMPSELPEVARTKHHWIVLLRPPSLWHAVAGLGVLVLAVIWPAPWLMLFIVLVGAVAFLRWQTWQAELIILTQKRIIRVQGVPETTTSEAFLRLDRISGARLVQTVPGKILKYGTVELEAPGDHPDVRRLKKIPEPHRFYGELRRRVFGELAPDPDEAPPPPDEALTEFVTAPLPRVVDERGYRTR
jgi:hypothetical protein